MTEEQIDIKLSTSKDEMTVLVDGTISLDDIETAEKVIREKLKTLEISETTDQIDIEDWLRTAAASGSTLNGAVLYEGQRPVPPKDGEIEWVEDFFTRKFFVDPETGAIDYRRLATKNSVEADQLLARATPPVEGVEGVNVFGKRVKVRMAKPARIRVGRNVRHEEDDSFYASLSGRIQWRSGTLSVDEILTVPGDIGLESGHITHPGTLVVQNDILEGAKVDAAGDIEVRGVVEASDIRCGGKLVVHGGITGAEGRKIVVSETVHARFILDAHIEAGDSVIVEKEILHSTIQTRGAISVEGGRVVGGEMTALGGFVAHHTGSDASVRTEIVVGKDFKLARILKEPEAKLAKLKENRDKIHRTIDPLLRNLEALPPPKAEAVKKLAKQSQEVENEIAELQEEIERLRADSDERAELRAVVKGKVFAETVFTIKADTLRVRETQKGPLQAIASEQGTRLLPMTKT